MEHDTEAEKARLTPRINQALAEALKLFEVPEPKPEPEVDDAEPEPSDADRT
jgi:hypothetical protein